MPSRPPTGEAGKLYMLPASIARKRMGIAKYLDKMLTTWPPLPDDVRQELAKQLIAGKPRQ